MASDKNSTNMDQSDAVIEAVYDSALKPDSYRAFIDAWDDYFLTPATQRKFSVEEKRVRLQQLRGHFERAARIFQINADSDYPDQQSLVNKYKFAAFAINVDGRIVTSNPAAQTQLLDHGLTNIFDCPIYADAVATVRMFLDQALKRKIHKDAQLYVMCEHPITKETLVFVLEALSVQDPDSNSNADGIVLVKTTSITWTEENERMMTSAFGVTMAEVEIIQLLISGLSYVEIAEARNRSVNTIKTQGKAILRKTGVRSQAELLKLVISVLLISTESKSDTPYLKSSSISQNDETILWQELELPDRRRLQYAISGNPEGTPVLFLQPSTRPDFTPQIRQLFYQQNLSVITPVRPGVWNSSPVPDKWQITDIVEDYVYLINHLGLSDLLLVGFCSGGLYALELARKLKGTFRQIVLLDTGAPLDNMSKIRAMPKTQRRLFLTARLIPWVLPVPHRLVGADFNSGPEGERRTIKYFYTDSPRDEQAMKDPELYQITRDNIEYCFENVALLAANIIAWSQDWTNLLDQVRKSTPVHFIHGSENLMFPVSDILKLSESRPDVKVTIIKDAGQTLLYTHSEEFLQSLREAV